MIFNINFIRGEALTYQDRVKVLKLVKIALISTSAVLIMVISLSVINFLRARRSEESIRKLESSISEISERHNIDEWGSLWSGLRGRTLYAERVIGERSELADMLLEISRLIPREMTVSQIHVSAGAERVMNLNIITLTSPRAVEEVNNFIQALFETSAFEHMPQLVSQREARTDGKDVIYFEVTVRLS